MQKLSALSMPWPADWDALFGRRAPLILEIGFGKGHFLFHLARAFPDHNIVGLEIANQCLVAAERKLERGEAGNVRVIHAPAETALHHLFEPETLEQVHVNFPDPWFKARHSHRRLMQRDTLDAIVSRMEPGGLFYLATDIVEYAEMSAELLADTPGLGNLLPGPWAHEMPGRTTTKYEATARREGRQCYYFAYRRNRRPAPDVPVLKELPMPHLVVTMPLSPADIQSRFEPFEHHEGETVLKFISCFAKPDVLLFEVFVKEPTIAQRLAVVLTWRSDGKATLTLGSLGQPRPTVGAHRAVGRIGAWLAGLDPGLEIVDARVRGMTVAPMDEDQARSRRPST